MTARQERLPELGLVWALFAVVAVEVFVTYARLPASDLYHVTGTGFGAGASRALLFLNFPVALVAIAIVLVLLDRIESRGERALALLAMVVCAAVFWPKVVNQDKLDARPVNAIAAIGVALAFALTVRVARGGLAGRLDRRRGDLVRLALGIVLLGLGLPWLAADLGFSFDGVPVLGTLYQTGELRTQPGDPILHHAVHHGHHHGTDGVLLVASALLLSRLVPAIRGRFVCGLLGAYLALLACYGAGNIANDFWLEQVVKRGWTLWEVPDVTTPKVSGAWAIIVVGAIVVWVWLVLPLVRCSAQKGAASSDPTAA